MIGINSEPEKRNGAYIKDCHEVLVALSTGN